MDSTSSYPQACERVVGSGDGATEYLLSMGNQNRDNDRIGDTEGSDWDGDLSDNFPASVCCSVST